MKKIRDIIRNKEAGIDVRLFAIIIVAILVVAGIAIYLYPEIIGSKSYWETETVFGMWQDEITIVYEDGSTASFKMLQESIPLTVTHEGKAVEEIIMRLRAKVTGTGYDGAKILVTETAYAASIVDSGGTTSAIAPYSTHTGTFNVPIGSTETITSKRILSSWIESTSTPDGSATIEFMPVGTVQYRGYPDGGDWKTVPLPPMRTVPIIISRTPTGSILVTLSSEL